MTIGSLGEHPADTLAAQRALRSEAPAELLRLVRDRVTIIEGTLVEAESVVGALQKAGASVNLHRKE